MSDHRPEHPGIVLRRIAEQRRAAQHADKQPTTPLSNVTPLDDERARRYAAKALDAELDELSHATEGERNDRLNTAAFKMGTLIAAGVLDEQPTRDALTAVAHRIGLTKHETAATINSGITAGLKQPRELPASNISERVVTSTPSEPFGHVDDTPPPDEPDTERYAGFWDERPLLAHIQQAARARMCSPWAVLGCVLARVVTATPHTVVLPPIIGSVASLNMFVALVGASGDGKGAAERVAAECVQLGHPLKTTTPGSGEGLVDAYKEHRGRDGDVWLDDRHAVLFTVPEIDTMTALSNRQGSTLMPELRRAWSGESLGHHYRDKSKRITVEAQQYRLCLLAGIQPQRAKALLDDADGGTPQRFVWVPVVDDMLTRPLPEWPGSFRWHPPVFARSDLRDPLTARVWMSVPDVARDTIVDARFARARGEGDALDGHMLLCQLKTAAAFAIADTRLDISIDDWRLAELLMHKSNATRARVALTLEQERARRNRSRAIGDGERAVIVDEMQHDAACARVARRILNKLAHVDDIAHSALRNTIAMRDRGTFDEVIDELIDNGKVRQIDVAQGVRYARR